MIQGLVVRFFILSLVSLLCLLSACVPYQTVQPNHPDYRPVVVKVPPVKAVRNGSIFQDQTAVFLYRDRKASRVGDIITVVLSERTQASKNADTEMSKNNTTTLPNPTLLGRGVSLGFGGTTLEMSQTSDRDFTAESDSEQNNSLQGTITVTVSEILANGNIIVQGEKWITLNQGDEFIRLSGLIRPEDINSDNTVESGKIANAKIIYSGTGALADTNVQGWAARFFNSPFWPF